MSKFKIYFKSILIPLLIGGIVSIIISGSIDYNSLQKPPFAPPSILFPIMWTILYILMGVSYGLLEERKLTDSSVNTIYYLQLFVNAFWSIFFFNLKWRLFAFVWIVLLVVLVFIMILTFYKKFKAAGLLQIPYLIWSLFATYLNLFIFLLNR